MAAEAFDFNVLLGDVIYSDTILRGFPHAVTVRQKWAKYRQNLAYPHFRRLRDNTGLYSHWDDHEFINDFSVPEHGRQAVRQGREGLSRLQPGDVHASHRHLPVVQMGELNLEIFLPDLRSFRSAGAGAAGLCTNPMTVRPAHRPDAAR